MQKLAWLKYAEQIKGRIHTSSYELCQKNCYMHFTVDQGGLLSQRDINCSSNINKLDDFFIQTEQSCCKLLLQVSPCRAWLSLSHFLKVDIINKLYGG